MVTPEGTASRKVKTSTRTEAAKGTKPTHPTHALGFILSGAAGRQGEGTATNRSLPGSAAKGTVSLASTRRLRTRSIEAATPVPSESVAITTITKRRTTRAKTQLNEGIKPAAQATTDANALATAMALAQSYAQKRLVRKCTVADCTNYTINKGLCFRHGGGKKCTFDGCNTSAKIAGLCWKHGGSIPCVVDGCKRRGKSRGLCWHHGGGTKCQTQTCEKVAVSNGFCWAHGGGKRCHFNGCQRPAYERTLNYCPKHFKKFENGEEVLEL